VDRFGLSFLLPLNRRPGSIEVGKDAYLLIWSGDPLCSAGSSAP
jgi:imidazolonepropionase-like amidohydrolase